MRSVVVRDANGNIRTAELGANADSVLVGELTLPEAIDRALGTKGLLGSSASAIKIARTELPEGPWYDFAEASDGTLVLVGAKGALYTKDGGATYEAATLPAGVTAVYNVCWDKEGFFARTNSRGFVKSVDGVTYTTVELAGLGNLAGIASGKGVYCVLENNKKLWTSRDLVTFTARTTPMRGEGANGIAYGDGKFIALPLPAYSFSMMDIPVGPTEPWPSVPANTREAAISDDGENWSIIALPDVDDGFTFAALGGGAIVVGNQIWLASGTPGAVECSLALPYYEGYVGVAYGDFGWFVAVARGKDHVLVSGDKGQTWRKHPVGIAKEWSRIKAVKGGCCLLAQDCMVAITWSGEMARLGADGRLPMRSLPEHITGTDERALHYGESDGEAGKWDKQATTPTATGNPIRYNGELRATKVFGAYYSDGADFAERYEVEGPAEPGELVTLGKDGVLRRCVKPDDPRCIGVVSTAPGYTAGGDVGVPIALVGRVPVKVIGPVRPGDYLTSSAMPGHAWVRDVETAPIGSIVGMALTGSEGPEPGVVTAFLKRL